MSSIIAFSGSPGQRIRFPTWGRCVWQTPDDELVCLYASGDTEINLITSADSGVSWSSPQYIANVDNFSIHDNFDCSVDRDGNIHVLHRLNASGNYTYVQRTGPNTWNVPFLLNNPNRPLYPCGGSISGTRGVNGSLEVYDEFLYSPPKAFNTPAVRIVGVDGSGAMRLFNIRTPFTAFQTSEGLVKTSSTTPLVGPSGGYPIYTNAGDNDTPGIVFMSDRTTTGFEAVIRFYDHPGSNFRSIGSLFVIAEDPIQSSRAGCEMGPNMAWCRTFSTGLFPIFMSAKEKDNFELISTFAEPFGPFGADDRYLARANSTQGAGTGPESRIGSNGYTVRQLISEVAGGTVRESGGTPVDMTYYDEDNVLYLYVQGRRENGNQTIHRFKVAYSVQEAGNPTSVSRFTFPELVDQVSGVINWADASLNNAGAGAPDSGNLVHWQRFKVPRSPLPPSGTSRQEVIMTIGSGLIGGSGAPTTNIYAWRFEDSIAAQGDMKLATYIFDLTARSGTDFVGINTFSGITNPSNLFDGDTSTSGAISSGDSITLEFSGVFNFNRIEFPWNGPASAPSGFLGVKVEASYDNSTYNTVANIPSGFLAASPGLVKATSEQEFIQDDPTVSTDIDSFSARYVRLTFDANDANPRDVREIRLLGGNTTAGFLETNTFDVNLIGSEIFAPEDFSLVAQGSIPSEWSTSGDFSWLVDKGTHASGAFLGEPFGSGNNSAITIPKNTAPNTSGFLEIPFELEQARTISFDVKLDFKANIGVVSSGDPNDDYLFVNVIDSGGLATSYDAQLNSVLTTTPGQYATISIPVSTLGANTLQIIYRRGNIPVGLGSVVSQEGRVYLDNFTNIAPVQFDFNKFTSLNAYIEGQDDPTITSGLINSYISGIDGSNFTTNAYISGFIETPDFITNAYLLSEIGTTGSISAYINSGRDFDVTNAYISGFLDTPSSSVNAYMFTSGAAEGIFAHIKTAANVSVNAYLKAPSGALDSVDGYIRTPQFQGVNAYIKTQETGMMSVFAYLDASGIGDQLNAYMPATGLFLGVDAYIQADGAGDSIFAVMPVGVREDINAYINGASPISGVINSWISGVSFVANGPNGYILGISGVIETGINGFIEGAQAPNQNINAHIIGFDSGEGCNFPIPMPSSVPFPTGNFFT